MSPFQRENFPPICGKVKKLIPNLHDKTKYVLHYCNLQLYVSIGMKIKKIQRVIEFKQSAWMKPYIDLNSQKRLKYKLFNNSWVDHGKLEKKN